MRIRNFLIILSCAQFLAQSLTAAIDSNNSGFSDVWERMYGAVGLNPNGDEDGDGFSNSAECAAGTDPFDAASFPEITHVEAISDGFILSWPAIIGFSYQIETSIGGLDGPWLPSTVLTAGSSGELNSIVTRPGDDKAFYRVAVIGGPLAELSLNSGVAIDSDGDGLSDLHEFMTGTDPSDPNSRFEISSIVKGSGLMVQLRTVPGKRYQLQKRIGRSGNSWINVASPVIANSAATGIFLPDTAPDAELRLSVSDIDSDGDGANDWEEIVTGFDPKRPQTHVGKAPDAQAIQELLATSPRYAIEARNPTAIAGSDQPGAIIIRRIAGLGPAKLELSISGSGVQGYDVESIPTFVTIPVGEESTELPITALPNGRNGREVTVSLQDPTLAAAGHETATVRVLVPTAYSVTDFGATGDGITDDRAAIQSAIDALEANPQINTLHFPAGTYCLDSFVASAETNSGNHRMLKLGNSDLAGRDIRFTGEPRSVLFSTVSPIRAHMLIAMASFRSLTFKGITFEKNSTPLAPGNPIGADGVSLVRVDRRIVEAVSFRKVVFSNCHSSVAIYGVGFDVRGNLRAVEFDQCEVLNPYGANVTNIQNYWGGGQQIPMNAWVGTARYTNSLFEGGGDDMTDHSKSPHGRLKDGCHFGSPMRLVFRNNVVRNMAVEAVYQTNRISYMGTTEMAFLVPPADGITPTVVKVRPEETTYFPGQILNLRIPTTGSEAGINSIFRVLAWDSTTDLLTLLNETENPKVTIGSVLPGRLPIYLQSEESGIVDISHNVLDGTLPPGAERTNPRGLVLDTKGVVANNAIVGLATGILNYKEASVPLFPGADGLTIRDNLIVTRHPDESTGPVTYGIETHASRLSIVRNLIICPESRRVRGIALRGENALVRDNQIIAIKQVENGYNSNQRSVGINVGNTSYATKSTGNTTKGFDVGVGPEPNQWIIHSVKDHTSIGDVLAIDFRGLVD